MSRWTSQLDKLPLLIEGKSFSKKVPVIYNGRLTTDRIIKVGEGYAWLCHPSGITEWKLVANS